MSCGVLRGELDGVKSSLGRLDALIGWAAGKISLVKG